MKDKFLKCLVIAMTLMFAMISRIPMTVSAAGFAISTSAEQVTVGDSFTINVLGSVAGRFDATVTSGSLNTNSIFIDNVGDGGSFTVKATEAGSIYVKVVATDATDSSYEAVTGSQGLVIKVVDKQSQRPSKPAESNGNSSSGNSSNSTSSADKNQTSINTQQTETSTENVETDTKTEEKVETVETVTLKSDSVGVVEIFKSLESADILEGFDKVELSVVTKDKKEEKVEAYKNPHNDEYVLFGQNGSAKGQENSFFLYCDKEKEIVSTFRMVAILGNKYGVVNELNTLENVSILLGDTDNFYQTKTLIDKVEYNSFGYNDERLKNYTVLYLMDETGKYGLYQYEKTSQTLQPYTSAFLDGKLNIESFEDLKKLKLEDLNVLDYTFMGSTGLFFLLWVFGMIRHHFAKRKWRKERKMLKNEERDGNDDSDGLSITGDVHFKTEEETTENIEYTKTYVRDTDEDKYIDDTIEQVNAAKKYLDEYAEDVYIEEKIEKVDGKSEETKENKEMNDINEIDSIIDSINNDLNKDEVAEEEEPHQSTLEILSAKFNEAEKKDSYADVEIKTAADYNLDYADKLSASGGFTKRRKEKEIVHKFDIEEYYEEFVKMVGKKYIEDNKKIFNDVFNSDDKDFIDKKVNEFIKTNRQILLFVANKIHTSFNQYQIHQLIEIGSKGYDETLDELNDQNCDTFIKDAIVNISKAIICYIYDEQNLEK